MMTLLMEYWWLAIAILAILIIAFMFLITYINLPNSKKTAKVKEWLLFAVVQAEKELGSGTGQLKLRYVYNLAASGNNRLHLPQQPRCHQHSGCNRRSLMSVGR